MVYKKDVYYTLVCLKCVVQLYYILDYELTESHKVRNDRESAEEGVCWLLYDG